MGIMDVTAFLKNSTECDSWGEIKASHKSEGQSVELKLSEVYGMLCLLAFGLFAATASFTVEKLNKTSGTVKSLQSEDRDRV